MIVLEKKYNNYFFHLLLCGLLVVPGRSRKALLFENRNIKILNKGSSKDTCCCSSSALLTRSGIGVKWGIIKGSQYKDCKTNMTEKETQTSPSKLKWYFLQAYLAEKVFGLPKTAEEQLFRDVFSVFLILLWKTYDFVQRVGKDEQRLDSSDLQYLETRYFIQLALSGDQNLYSAPEESFRNKQSTRYGFFNGCLIDQNFGLLSF